MELYRVPMSGGVNLLSDPRTIRDDELVKAGNLVPVRPGVLQTRPAIESLPFSIVGSMSRTTAFPLSALFGPWADSPMFVLHYTAGTGAINAKVSLSAYTLDGQVAIDTQTLMSFTPSNVGVRPWITPYQGALYFLTGEHTAPVPAFTIQRGQIAAQQFAFAGTGNADMRPRVAVAYRNRVVWANFGPGYENTLVFSDNFAPSVIGNDALASNGRNVSLVAAADGDEIIGLAPIMLTDTGTPVESGLLVLRRYSSFLITGEPDQTSGGTPTIAVNRMSIAAGCASPWTIKSTPYGVFWAGQDEVWHYHSGQNPRQVGTKIQPALMRTPRSLGYKLSASYFGGFYRLALFGETQVAPTYADGPQDQWWLDLRNGPPNTIDEARWWGPQTFTYPNSVSTTTGGYNIMLRDDRPGGEARLYGFEIGTAQFSGITGTTQGIIVRYDVDAPVDTSWPLNPTGSISTQTIPFAADATIKPDLITKEFDLGDPMLQKIYDGMEANVWASQSGRLLAQGILDGGASYAETNLDVTAAGYAAGEGAVGVLGVAMPRAPQAIAAYDTTRPIGTTVQLRLQGQAGFTVDATNDEFAFESNNAFGDDPSPAVAQLTRGFYATYADFMTMLVAAMNVEATGDVQYLHNANGTFSLGRDSGGDCQFTVMFATPTATSTATATQIAKTSRIGVLLGFNTDVNATVSGTSPVYVTGAMAVWNYTAPIWELNGLGLRLEAIPRRP